MVKKQRKASPYSENASLEKIINIESQLNNTDGKLQVLHEEVNKIIEEFREYKAETHHRSVYKPTGGADNDIHYRASKEVALISLTHMTCFINYSAST
jgi:hypothetical protein